MTRETDRDSRSESGKTFSACCQGTEREKTECCSFMEKMMAHCGPMMSKMMARFGTKTSDDTK